MNFVLFFLIGFLAGGIPFGFLIGKLKGVDIRKAGSGNIGAANVARLCGKKAGGVAFLFDVVKGFLPAFIVARYSINYGITTGVGAVLGHMFTPFLKFRGGKGVSTALGVFLGLVPVPVLLCFGIWVVVLLGFRYVSVASMTAAVCAPVLIYFMKRPFPLILLAIAIACLILVRHISNIKRLLKGKEPKFNLH